MADLALYRKYRSGTFAEVIGQDHVVKTLLAALASGRHVHAYLFTGPRGTGKTSVARLLARALSCTGADKPCNACANCQAAINSSLDVIEIDAASNRSIDAVRDLREKVGLAPTRGQYKVYIIDEVHMLTTEAFNALLKTLEEPPAHAVFILATTEVHKLPDTIISRTQRFNFRPIETAAIINHLKTIAASEGIPIEPEALELIATTAQGGFRDAISLLDQLGSTGAQVTLAAVRDVLGYSDAEEINAINQAIIDRNSKTALEILARLEASGAQPGQVATQLTESWRSVLRASAGTNAPVSKATAQLAAATTPLQAARTVEVLLDTLRSPWPALALEAAVVKLTAGSSTSPASTQASTPEPKPAARPAAASTAEKAPPAAGAPAASAPESQPQGPEQTNPNDLLSAKLWPKVLVLLKSQNNSLCALLQMYEAEFGASEITIKPRFNFHRDLFLKPANRTLIEAAASKVYGRRVLIGAKTAETAPKARRQKPDPSAELVSSALEILGGEVVE